MRTAGLLCSQTQPQVLRQMASCERHVKDKKSNHNRGKARKSLIRITDLCLRLIGLTRHDFPFLKRDWFHPKNSQRIGQICLFNHQGSIQN